MLTEPKSPLHTLKRKQSLYQAVQEEIKTFIIENDLRPGDPLPNESELPQKLKVSRNAVREAVKSLEARA